MYKRILLLGGEGFCGRAFVRYFKQLKDVEVEIVDIKNGHDCREWFKTHADVYDLVIHLAAIVGGRMKIENDPIAVATDLSIDAEMFNWAVRTKQERIVYFSSSAAYPIQLQDNWGFDNKIKLREIDLDLDDIRNPDMTYGWAKLTGEMLTQYARDKGIKVYVFRPFSGYGEDQDLDYPFPSFIKRIKDRVPEFEIWGDGEQVRDFIHIDDVVGAVMKAIELDNEGPINLGTGIGTSFNELAQLCMDIGKYHAPIKHLLDKPVGVTYRVADNTKMLRFYKPKISLIEGIKRALQYEKR